MIVHRQAKQLRQDVSLAVFASACRLINRPFANHRICKFEPEALADFLDVTRLAPQAQMIGLILLFAFGSGLVAVGRNCDGTRPPLGSDVSVAVTAYITSLAQDMRIQMNPKRPLGPGAVKQLSVKADQADVKRGASWSKQVSMPRKSKVDMRC